MSLENFVYDRTIDYIQNRARDSELRDKYDAFMSAQNYNNREFKGLVDVILTLADEELDNNRRDSEDRIVKGVIEQVVDCNCAAFALSDRRISDSLDDRAYNDVKRSAAEWDAIVRELSRGRGRGRDSRDRDDRGGRNRNQSRSSWGGGSRSSNYNNDDNPLFKSKYQTNNSNSRDGESSRKSIWGGNKTETVKQVEQRVTRQEPKVEAHVDGPDFSKPRPYDDFYADGEHWQLAHKSKWSWSWSKEQQFRRTYDVDSEVCFLVRDKNNHVREEFLPMTEDLEFTAHEIRTIQRPNARKVNEREESDVFVFGNDIDVADLDQLNKMRDYIAKQYFGDVAVNPATVNDSPSSISTLDEAVVRIAAEATRSEDDIVANNNFVTIPMVTDKETINALQSVIVASDGSSDLKTLARRLKSLRGVISENVMNFIDKHFTDEVNRATKEQFGINVTMTTFVDDFEALLECRTMQNVGKGAAEQFLVRTKPILGSLQYLLDLDDRKSMIESMDLLPEGSDDPESYKNFAENIIVMFKPMAMVHVKLESSGLPVVDGNVRQPAKVGEHADRELAAFLVSVFGTARRACPTGRVHMVTADNMVYELVAMGGSRDTIGIKLVV